ncbi:MAG: DMT family transporter [Wenzhouxiangella sp.]
MKFPWGSVLTGRQRSGIVLTVLGVAGFSAKAIFAKLAYPWGVDPITLMTLRSAIAVPVLWLVFWLRADSSKALGRRGWVPMIWAGISGYYLSAWLDFYGLQTVTATLERLILFLYPCFVVLLVAALNRQRLAPATLLALGLAYGGVMVTLATGGWDQVGGDWVGIALVLAAAMIFATYYVIAGDLVRRLSAVRFSAYVMTIAGAATLTHFLLQRPALELFLQPAPVYGFALGLGLVSTVLPILLISEGLRRIDTSTSASINLLGPGLTVIMAYLILGERLEPLQWLGFAMVLAGVFSLGRRLGPPPETVPRVRPSN